MSYDRSTEKYVPSSRSDEVARISTGIVSMFPGGPFTYQTDAEFRYAVDLSAQILVSFYRGEKPGSLMDPELLAKIDLRRGRFYEAFEELFSRLDDAQQKGFHIGS